MSDLESKEANLIMGYLKAMDRDLSKLRERVEALEDDVEALEGERDSRPNWTVQAPAEGSNVIHMRPNGD